MNLEDWDFEHQRLETEASVAEIRAERRPNSRYASIENCRMEVSEAEAMMRRLAEA